MFTASFGNTENYKLIQTALENTVYFNNNMETKEQTNLFIQDTKRALEFILVFQTPEFIPTNQMFTFLTRITSFHTQLTRKHLIS